MCDLRKEAERRRQRGLLESEGSSSNGASQPTTRTHPIEILRGQRSRGVLEKVHLRRRGRSVNNKSANERDKPGKREKLKH